MKILYNKKMIKDKCMITQTKKLISYMKMRRITMMKWLSMMEQSK